MNNEILTEKRVLMNIGSIPQGHLHRDGLPLQTAAVLFALRIAGHAFASAESFSDTTAAVSYGATDVNTATFAQRQNRQGSGPIVQG